MGRIVYGHGARVLRSGGPHQVGHGRYPTLSVQHRDRLRAGVQQGGSKV